MIKTNQLRKKETYDRIKNKSHRQAFINYIHKNTNLSIIESEIVLDEFIEEFLDNQQNAYSPLQTNIIATKIDSKHGKSLSEVDFEKIKITLHNEDDDKIRENPTIFFKKYNFNEIDSTTAVRRNKLLRITYEVYKNNCVLTQEDLAYTIFNCGIRTIQRDIQAFKKADIFIPLRGTVCDIGKSVSHKVEAIKLLLKGMELNEISKKICHTPQAVERYLKKFIQVCIALKNNLRDPEISMLTESSYSLIGEYKKIYEDIRNDDSLGIIENLMKKTPFDVKKTESGELKC